MTEKGGLVSTVSRIDDRFLVHMIMRKFHGSTEDYYAIATRTNDELELGFSSRWKWLLKLKTRRRPLERAFKRYDKRQRKLDATEDLVI